MPRVHNWRENWEKHFPGGRRFPFPRRFAFSRRFEFSRSFAFPWRFAFPGDSSFLAVRVSWRFPCPGDSRVLATPNTSCGLASRALVVLQLTSTQSRFLVAFGAPAPSSKMWHHNYKEEAMNEREGKRVKRGFRRGVAIILNEKFHEAWKEAGSRSRSRPAR